MILGKRKRKQTPIAFDKTGKTPVIRSSICTGEQVAGFRDDSTGRFLEIMLLQSPGDYQDFLRLYDVDESEVKREW